MAKSKQKLDRVKRKAAGHVLMMTFHTLNSGVRHFYSICYNGELAAGLTPKEKEKLMEMAGRAHALGELSRKFAWRLIRDSQ